MPTIERGNFMDPKKSAYNFEVYESGLERKMMERLEAEHTVRKWTKKQRHRDSLDRFQRGGVTTIAPTSSWSTQTAGWR